VVAGHVLEELMAASVSDEGGYEDVGVEKNLHDTCEKTSSSV